MDGAALLDELAREPLRAALLLDVDGVLAPIVARPEDAAVPEDTRAELRRLAARYGLVACISGRPTASALEVVGVDGLVYVGEHGLELDPDAEAWGERLDRFLAGVDWEVERKWFSAALHFRRAEDEGAARSYLEGVAEAARAEGLVAYFGRKVLEIRPPVEANKGTAVRRLLEEQGLRRALYAGDDTTDLDAFAALDGLEVGVRVAVVSAEAPPGLRDAADVVVETPEEFVELLRRL